jgi:hypothetical protein
MFVERTRYLETPFPRAHQPFDARIAVDTKAGSNGGIGRKKIFGQRSAGKPASQFTNDRTLFVDGDASPKGVSPRADYPLAESVSVGHIDCRQFDASCNPRHAMWRAARLINKRFRIDFVWRIGTADRVKRLKTIVGEVTQIGVSQADTGYREGVACVD